MSRRFVLILVLLLLGGPPAHASDVGLDSLVYSVAFSPNSKLLASGVQNGNIRLWSVPGLDVVRDLVGHKDGITALVFSKDGHTLYSASMDRTIRIWSVDSGQCVATLAPHSDDVLSIALSPDGKWLAASSYDGKTVIWDVARRSQLPARLSGHTVDWSRDGRLLSTASIDGTIHLYDAGGKPVASWKGHTLCPNAARFSPDGRLLVSVVDDVKLWDVKSHTLVADLNPQVRQKLSSAVWSADGRHLAVSTPFAGGLRYDLVKGKWARTILVPGTDVQNVAFSPDQRYLAIGNLHGTVELLDAASGRVVARRLGRVKAPPVGPRK